MKYLGTGALGLACFGLSSCISVVTHGVGTIERALSVGDDFAKWKPQAPPIPAGSGRIVVYPGGGLSVVYDTTSFGKGGEEYFAVDRDVCSVLGHSFVFFDIAAGPHEMSVDDVSDFLDPFHYTKGRNKLDLSVAPAAVAYIRIDKDRIDAFSSHYYAKPIEAPTAEAELNDFVIYNDGLKCKPNKAEDRKPESK